jgi:hypothetical protein
VIRGGFDGPRLIDGRPVERITAYLFDQGTSEDPERLHANDAKCFVGNEVLGIGFTFDDDDRTGKAGTLAEMRRLIEKNPHNGERIRPYLNGQEVNQRPVQLPDRYVIDFGTMAEREARRWPDLMDIVERKVKPERLAQKRDIRARYWWRFGEASPALYRSIADRKRVLVRALTSTHFPTFTFLPAEYVYDQTLIVFPFQQAGALAILASSVHELWALFMGGSMKDDPRYNVEDCFRSFPFPVNWEKDSDIEDAGKAYDDFRVALMFKNNEGLTKTYNRFHDPEERDPEIATLRELHAAMDRAVLDAYGWPDILPRCEFLLDYEKEKEETVSRRKKPWRYWWPDEFRDEILARLLELNRQRAEQEMLDGPPAMEKKPRKPGPKKPPAQLRGHSLFPRD